MQLEVGDCVVHRTFGIGQIVDLVEKKTRSGGETRLYYQVDIERTTVWVQVESPNPPSIRPITRKEELDRYRGILSSRPVLMEDDYRKRQSEIEQRLKQGTLQAACEIMRDLTARGWDKPLPSGDAATLHKVEKVLLQEWSAAEGITLREAAKEIESLLQKSRREVAA